jgi:hypothetical protein
MLLAWPGVAFATSTAATSTAATSSAAASSTAASSSDAGGAHSPVEDVYDPYEGMDRSGRIPAVEKPADLPNPDRWRYIPEGRIKPGNFFQRFLVTSFVVPVVFRDPDTGTGGGLGITDIDFRGQRRREFAGFFLSYTSKKQQSYWGLWRRWLHHRELPGGGVLQEERSFVGVSGGYQKTLTRRFFGFGANSKESNEIRYTDKLLELELELEMAIPEPGADLVGTVGLRGEYHSLSTDDFDCDEVFSDPVSAGCPDAWDQTALFRQFIDNDDHERIGYLVTGLRWDTRDSQRNPYRGFEVGLRMEAPLLQNGWDVGARFQLDASTAVAVPGIFHSGAEGDEENPPTDTLAFGASVWHSEGDMPFTGLPALGGPLTLRGYQAGRFRDKAAWHAGVEHRIWVIPRGFEITPTIRVERIGLAPFVEVGSVGESAWSAVGNDVKLSYGVGLRILLERAAPFRLDFGFSDEGVEWTARFGYTF